MTLYRFDTARLAMEVDRELVACDMSYRALCRELDISTNSFFTRMHAGYDIRSDGLATVLHWMRLDASIARFITEAGTR